MRHSECTTSQARQSKQMLARNRRKKRSGDEFSQVKRRKLSLKDSDSNDGPKVKENTTEDTAQKEAAIRSAASEASIRNSSQSHSDSPSLSHNLSDKYDLKSYKIDTWTKINSKVIQIIQALSQYPTPIGSKTPVVLLRARSVACGKMISIVEIVKREIGGEEIRGKWYQYNVLGQLLEESEPNNKKKERSRLKAKDFDNEDHDNNEDDDDEAAFEIMKTPFERAIEGVPKKRIQPILEIYLSRVRIESLRMYGEQTNGVK